MSSAISPQLQAIVATFSADLKEKVLQWLQWDKNSKTLAEITKLVEEKNVTRLSEMLLQRQSFGTAGIRGFMEAGSNGLNDLVIIQTTQGLVKYLLSLNLAKSHDASVVIGHDGRHNSHRFARLAAQVCLTSGFRVHLFSRVVPTPFVAFATRHFSAAAGIMVTASHNPKQYNGYKVYFQNGAQILSPHDEHIQTEILKNLEPWSPKVWEIDSLSDDPRVSDPLEEVSQAYYQALKQGATQAALVSQSDIKVTYTALHGVGHLYLTKAFDTLGFKNYFPVMSQKDPDPEFSTVVFPNPEEGQGVLDESIKTAEASGSTLIFANDPDSDRFAMAERNTNGHWRVFNGNEIGALFGWWIWSQTQSQVANKTDCYMLSSAVSSKILETYAKKEGFSWMETLTGFKWMGNFACDLEKQGKKVLLAFEEAIGFMVGTAVYDKDGISAAATMLQLAAYLHSKGLTFEQQLKWIYTTYGYHFSLNSYYICHDTDKIRRIFERMANLNGPNTYVTEINNVKVVRVRDLIRSYDSSSADHKAQLPNNTMITFYFENGSVVTLRTSGTEPKIKYYSEIAADPSLKDWSQVREAHRQLVEALVQHMLEPEKNELLAKRD